MIIVLLTILKIIGIVLLCVLGLLLTVLFLVLFVPVRYRITAVRRAEDEAPVRVKVKVTWLLHIVNAAFGFPDEAFLRVRLLCFTVFSTDKSPEKEKSGSGRKKQKKEKEPAAPEEKREVKADNHRISGDTSAKDELKEDQSEKQQKTQRENPEEKQQETRNKFQMILDFLRKLFDILKNIQYTIRKIYDKIKEIIENIRYYLEILQSDVFKRAFSVCSGEVRGLLRGILPYKVRGSLRIGTGDPAGTAQIIGIQGILYPLIGDHITIIPDFDHTIAEGDLFVKGKITLFRALKTAVRIYFNKDLRKVIRLLKKEAA